MLGIKPATLYAYVSRGLIQSYRRGVQRARLYRRTDLENLLRIRPGDSDPASPIPLAADWMPFV